VDKINSLATLGVIEGGKSMHVKRRQKRFQHLLITTLAIPFAPAFGGDLTGTWEGGFSCGGDDFTWQLAIEEPSPGKVEGELVFARTFDGVRGANKVGGQFNQRTNLVNLSARGWIRRFRGRKQLGFRGTYDASSNTISGQFVDRTCSPFEITRTTTEVALGEPPAPAAVAETRKPAPTDTTPQTTQQGAKPSGGRVRIAGQRNPAGEERCLEVMAWTDTLEQAFPELDFDKMDRDLVPAYIVNIFDAEHFVPVFGKTFESLNEQERYAITLDQVQHCMSRPGRQADYQWQLAYLGTAFNSNNPTVHARLTYPRVIESLAENRETVAWLDTVRVEAAAIEITADNYEKIVAIRQEVARRFATRWPSYRNAFEAETHDLWSGRAQLALTRVIDGAIAATEHVDDIRTLRTVMTENADMAAAAGTEASNVAEARIDEHVIALARPATEQHRQALFDLGMDSEALHRQIDWHADYVALKDKVIPPPDFLVALEDEFLQHRKATWNKSESEITAMLKNAKSTIFIDQYTPPIAEFDEGLEAPKRIQAATSQYRGALALLEQKAFNQRWGIDYARARQVRPSLTVRPDDLDFQIAGNSSGIDYVPQGRIWDPLIEPYGPTFAGTMGAMAGQAVAEFRAGRALLDQAERDYQESRLRYYICDDECEDRELVAQELRRRMLDRDFGVAAWNFVSGQFGLTLGQQAEAQALFAGFSGGHLPTQARHCRREIRPWSSCVAQGLGKNAGNYGAIQGCWGDYGSYNRCRNIAEQTSMENDFLSQAGSLLIRKVDEDLAWLANGVKRYYSYESVSNTLAKSDEFVRCFGEDRMQQLSRKYLHPDANPLCSSGSSELRCVMEELGIDKDDEEIGSFINNWQCTAE
jgi:hypothetical protein